MAISQFTGGNSEAAIAGFVTASRTRTDESVTEGLGPERYYVAAVESSIHAFVTVDFDGIITSWSPGAERMFGHSAAEAVGRSIELIMPPGDGERFADSRSKIRQGSQAEIYEAVRIAKDGRKVHVVVTLSPIKERSGAVIGVCAILSDVTSQRLAEQLFGTVVEACPNAMIVADEAGRMVLVNSAATTLFGYARSELLEQSVDMLLPERTRDRHAELRREFMRHHGGGRMSRGRVMEARCKDGTEIGVEVGLNPITFDGRKMVLSVISDVSERLRVERMKNDFIATVSHELRTPLTSIAGSLGLLLGGAAGPQSPPVARLLSIAHRNCERLVRLIGAMLDIEKIESGQVVLDLDAIDVRALVEQAIDGTRGFAEQYGVQVRLESNSPTCTVCVDADRIVQVMTNLLSNACKFSPAGGKIEVRIEPHDATVRVSIRDHGPGIPQAFKSRVFGKFAQADGSNTRQKSGTGLGLNIVKQLVTQHGGRVGFDDAPGGGTIFFFDLPTLADEATHGLGSAEAPHQRAMICSADLDMSSAMSAVLRARGFLVDVVSTASAAVARAETEDYSLFVVDLPTRELDGVGMIRLVHARGRQVQAPIIAVVSDPRSCGADLRYDDLGIVAWLDKPVDERRFAHILDRVRTGHGLPRILHVEDDPAMRELVAHRLKREFEIAPAATLEEAQQALRGADFDALLLDLGLPDGRGSDLLPHLHDGSGDAIPLVVHSGHDPDQAVSVRAGAVVAKAEASINEVAAALRRLVDIGRAPRHPDRGGE